MKAFVLALVLALVAAPAVAQHRPGGGNWHGPDRGGGGGWHNNWHPGGGGWNHGPNVGGVIGGIVVGNAISNWLFPRQQEVVVVPQQVPEIQPFTPGWYQYCGQKYQSFDARTGNYFGFDGQYHQCQ